MHSYLELSLESLEEIRKHNNTYRNNKRLKYRIVGNDNDKYVLEYYPGDHYSLLNFLRQNGLHYKKINNTKDFIEINKEVLKPYIMVIELYKDDSQLIKELCYDEKIYMVIHKKYGKEYVILCIKNDMDNKKGRLSEVIIRDMTHSDYERLGIRDEALLSLIERKEIINNNNNKTVLLFNNIEPVNKNDDNMILINNNVEKFMVEEEYFDIINNKELFFGNNKHEIRETIDNVRLYSISNGHFCFNSDGTYQIEEKFRSKLYNKLMEINFKDVSFIILIKKIPFRKIKVRHNTIVLTSSEKHSLNVFINFCTKLTQENNKHKMYEEYYDYEIFFINRLSRRLLKTIDSVVIDYPQYNSNILEYFRMCFHPLDNEQSNYVNHMREVVNNFRSKVTNI